MLRGQRAQSRREIGDAETVRRADPHRSRDVLALAGDFRAGGDHVGLHALGDAEEPLAGGRELAAGGEAAEEPCAERLLERGDTARHGGVVELEPARSAEDLAGTRDGKEDADIVPVHGNEPPVEGRHRSFTVFPACLRKRASSPTRCLFFAQRMRFRSRCQGAPKRDNAGQKNPKGSET